MKPLLEILAAPFATPKRALFFLPLLLALPFLADGTVSALLGHWWAR